jgi:hypothetical protein
VLVPSQQPRFVFFQESIYFPLGIHGKVSFQGGQRAPPHRTLVGHGGLVVHPAPLHKSGEKRKAWKTSLSPGKTTAPNRKFDSHSALHRTASIAHDGLLD